jgi:hypothetical protein
MHFTFFYLYQISRKTKEIQENLKKQNQVPPKFKLLF